ncbi:urease accessory protein UreE [Paucibacter sp. B2R-40]|uniref:urease accessory protein UreE n=1 Tax=Paucibacter sp. B2R-40 TaxID=2893554 RepID=UPI0021E4A026|nr:urease accessory protein UreE [Paucibacter sp. B2R-40]MCV2353764.1 urease accessory protein UreE [Paucibacter sp. B2R-40]
MLIINKLLPQGAGLAPVLLKRAGVLSLPFAARQHHEANLSDGQGAELGLRLPVGATLRDGDVLVAEDGSLLRVEAAPEALLQVRASAKQSLADLLRLAHQLGEMHVHMEAADDHLRLPGDPELAQWLERQDFALAPLEAPFDPLPLLSQLPEVIAQQHEHGHAHSHAHDHDHRGHVHGPGCNHGH